MTDPDSGDAAPRTLDLNEIDPDYGSGGPAQSIDTDTSAETDDAPADGRRRWLTPRQRNLVEWVIVIGGALIVASLLRAFLFQTFFIPSGSMMPTLVPGDRVVVNKFDDGFGRGDIVVFHRPTGWGGQNSELIKRVIGLPGETIQVEDNQVMINGQFLNEPYLEEDVAMIDYGPFTVPDGNIFVMGDNRGSSSDSRANGPVPIDDLVGRAVLRIWPLSSFGRL